ncbi:nickel pincer cofactor biosynthesis protein LarB [Roseisolibacter sp. H3M3-2]|uniref:nickel pincer cofactor biosynthesis protein LarB n=1 Tax=Roseisolibacter sp. H3M3-2 TaxID=3031323 RepID=UPI0023DC60DA|nr:nickel pincer cofactor biosynthesis protein LarB [Roseisolibacter sp. H3M3-2]MDF1501515.1 nickel pincer cofactor biosynthesis protein LarB [Roseisolibacter sp. H3M3-2]
MRRDRAMRLLEAVARGEVPPAAALDELALPPVEAVDGFAQLDHHRALRQGMPEVVFGQGKTAAQCVAICERLEARDGGFLVTRADDATRTALAARFPGAAANPLARTVRLGGPDAVDRGVVVVTAGTADLPVAEECVETLRALGVAAGRVTDVGVAGVHRVLAQAPVLAAAAVTIVVAGMDGALPSVVGGLVRGAVVAVPTSVGYGAAFQGLAPLLTMLNSCAAGVLVTNIDNGFGAAVAAWRILQSGNDLRAETSG